MDRHTIRQVMLELPTSELGEVQADNEIWEVTEGGAHFKMTRHQLPVEGSGLDLFSLSISGELQERARIASDFYAALGDPQHIESNSNPVGIDFLTWLVRRDAVR